MDPSGPYWVMVTAICVALVAGGVLLVSERRKRVTAFAKLEQQIDAALTKHGGEAPNFSMPADVTGKESNDPKQDDVTGSFNNWIIRTGLFLATVALTAIIFYSWQLPTGGWEVGMTAVVVCGAAFALGSFVGFLFGVPTTLQSPRAEDQPLAFVSNSNLEKISDWLTKIIVGAGLVQIASLPAAFAALGSSLAPAFGNTAASPVFAVGLLLYGFIVGFLLMYMWTRTRFLEILQRFEGKMRRQHATVAATVTPTPTVTAQPASMSVQVGQPVVFTAAASGAPAPVVQWQEAAPGSDEFTDISGATSATFTIPVVDTGDDGKRFRTVFRNTTGAATTDAATLTVTPA